MPTNVILNRNMENFNYIEKTLEDLKQIRKNLEIFPKCEASFTNDLKHNLKHLYDSLITESVLSSNALPELIIRNLDTEQIWQQIELQNENILNVLMRDVSRILMNKDKLRFNNIPHNANKEENHLENNENESSNGDSSEVKETTAKDKKIENMEEFGGESSDEHEKKNDFEQYSSDEESSDDNLEDKQTNTKDNKTEDVEEFDGKSSEEQENKNNLEQYSSDEDSDESMDVDDTNAVIKKDKSKSFNKRKSVVDDEFFKLDEMEKFLETEEKKLDTPKRNKNIEESDSESEESIDLFKNDSGDGEDSEEMKVKTARFKDFFKANEESKAPKRNRFLQDLSDDEDNEIKSSFELRQERLNRKIEDLEESAVSDKPWTLKGEITGDSRPQNSLLEEVVEFDMTSRPAPVITEKTTQQLEDIIKQRIKDKLFDSVVRKEKPVETLLEYKKKLVLEQEKSKHSLAQIYEKEYLEQQAVLDNNAEKEEEPELHKEIKTTMRELFNKLDSLSNFHFTPKPAIPELKIVTNLPAIVMEEVAPVTVSDAALLAPEEVRNKPKGDIIGTSEKTKTDKKRERRKKKQKQQLHVKKVVQKNLLLGSKNKSKDQKKVLNNKNIEKMVESLNSKTFKSSKAFFTELQEQVQSKISKQANSKQKSSGKSKIKSKKVKL